LSVRISQNGRRIASFGLASVKSVV
jgi:hypothetical protein